MVTIETADSGHAASICRVCSASWYDAYADVLPAEYVDANVRLRYDPERIGGQIEENGTEAEENGREGNDESGDSDDTGDSDESGDGNNADDTRDGDDSNDTDDNNDTEDNDVADGIGKWLVALDVEGEAPDSNADTPTVSESVVGAVRDDRPEPGVGEVSGLYVHPDWQGEGVGSKLLAALTERQRDRGVTEQRAYVFADNDDALGFYESKGFTSGERFAAATVGGVDPDCEAILLVRSV